MDYAVRQLSTLKQIHALKFLYTDLCSTHSRTKEQIRFLSSDDNFLVQNLSYLSPALATVLYGTVPATSAVSRPLSLVHLYDLGQIPEKQSLRQGFYAEKLSKVVVV